MGASLSQMTVLPEITQTAEEEPRSLYLEADNKECYMLNTQVIYHLNFFFSEITIMKISVKHLLMSVLGYYWA
jgi:hypothetical protein